MAQRILVVDDDKSIVKVLAGYLEQSGFHVIPAYDGESALHALRRERPDLILLDLMMPNRDGWEVTQIIRADKTLAARIEDTSKPFTAWAIGWQEKKDEKIMGAIKRND